MKKQDFKAWRNRYKMTQTHAAALLGGFTKRTLVNWENGSTAIDPCAVVAIKWFQLLPEETRLQLVEDARPARP